MSYPPESGGQAAADRRRWWRRPAGLLRSLRPGSVIALVLAFVLGGAGVAGATNGASFILGHSNTETATATLANTKGTPLKLSARAGSAR